MRLKRTDKVRRKGTRTIKELLFLTASVEMVLLFGWVSWMGPRARALLLRMRLQQGAVLMRGTESGL